MPGETLRSACKQGRSGQSRAYTPHQAFLARSWTLPDPGVAQKAETQQFGWHLVLSGQAEQIQSGPTYIHQDDLSIAEQEDTHDE